MIYRKNKHDIIEIVGPTKAYMINGYKYQFEQVHYEGGMLRGYCKKRKKWAWLADKYLQFDDEPLVLATEIVE